MKTNTKKPTQYLIGRHNRLYLEENTATTHLEVDVTALFLFITEFLEWKNKK